MSGRGRPNKYKTHVEPYLDQIKDLALTMTEEQIAETLGVAYSSFRVYKQQYSALNDALQKGRKDLVAELKSVLIKKAKGFIYEEKTIIEEVNPETGEMEIVRRETKIKYAQPDVAAGNLLLKNYDKENWANDPQALELRRKELELNERKLEANEW
ncbi:transposase [bacterium]|nr:transposase [bacterium]